MTSQRTEMQRWLKERCESFAEYDFWLQFYDDLDDCFDDLEPWRMAKPCSWDWHGWDLEFTGRRIEPDEETRPEWIDSFDAPPSPQQATRSSRPQASGTSHGVHSTD